MKWIGFIRIPDWSGYQGDIKYKINGEETFPGFIWVSHGISRRWYENGNLEREKNFGGFIGNDNQWRSSDISHNDCFTDKRWRSWIGPEEKKT